MSTGSRPKEQIAACPICVLPRKPQPPGTSDAKPAAGHDRRALPRPGFSYRYVKFLWFERDFCPGEESAVEDVCEVAFERAACFAGGLAFGELSGEIGLGLGVVALLDDRDAVQRGVELAVAACRSP
jgi:hypothetical protein